MRLVAVSPSRRAGRGAPRPARRVHEVDQAARRRRVLPPSRPPLLARPPALPRHVPGDRLLDEVDVRRLLPRRPPLR
jgi:hypothetical protein